MEVPSGEQPQSLHFTLNVNPGSQTFFEASTSGLDCSPTKNENLFLLK